MAKFKKKKSAPTPGKDESKPKVEDNSEVPEIEKSEPVENNSKEPSKDPPISAAEKSEKDKKLAKLFWMRIALGVIAGIATTFIFEDIEGEERRWASIGFMIIVFFGSIIVAKGMKMQLPSSDRKKIGDNLNGYDISPDMVKMSLVNMYLHNMKDLKGMDFIFWN